MNSQADHLEQLTDTSPVETTAVQKNILTFGIRTCTVTYKKHQLGSIEDITKTLVSML